MHPDEDKKIRDMIKRHEGYRAFLYFDTEGVLTGGYGHAFQEGGILRRDIADLLFGMDYNQAVTDFLTLDIPQLDPVRQAVLINMLYNLGRARFMQFRRMLAAIRTGDYAAAADEMIDSRWYHQVGSRARELEGMMRSGCWPDE